METALDIVRSKADRPLVTAGPDMSVLAATQLMNDRRVGSLLVMHRGRLVGIFTERDVLRRVVADLRSPTDTVVAEVMTGDVVCCEPETPIEDLAELMRSRRIRHVPVVDAEGSVAGLVSIGDVNAHRFASCEVALHQVEDYLFRRS